MTDSTLPRRRRLAAAVQLALTLSAGLYAPRIRAQQIACPAVTETVATATAVNALSCNITGTLDIDSGGALNNTGSLHNSGTLDISSGGTLYSANLLFNHSGATVINSGTLNNVGMLINESGASVVNSGTLTNSIGMANYGALTNNGTLNNSPGSALLINEPGATLTNNGTLNNGGRLYNYSGGMLNNTGTGTFNNLTGATLSNSGGMLNDGRLNNSGALNITSGGTLTANGDIVNYGTLSNRAGGTLNVNLANIFNEPGGVLANEGTLNNAGSLVNYAGSTLTNSGTLNNTRLLFNYSGAAVTNNGVLNNGVLGRLVNYGALTNNGTLNNNSLASLYNYSGATLTNNGTLNNNWSLYNFGALVNSAGATLNNNDFLYNAPGATLSNAGTLNNTSIVFLNYGALTNSGTLNNVTGALLSNLSGGTLVNSGVLINAGTLANAPGAALSNSGTLINSGELFNSGTLTNSGSLTVTSTGRVTGSSSITQSAGTLRVDGSVSQPVTINGGTLTGTGTITAPVVNSGTLLPGAAGTPGTLTIVGSLVQNPSAVLVVGVIPAQASRVTITGTASLAGTVQLVAGAGTYPSTPYTILSATGGVTGTFSGVSSSSAFLTGSLAYDPNTVFLSLTQTAAFNSVALTPNQVAVSTLIGNIQAGGSTDMQSVLATLSGLSAGEARAAFDSMAGAGNTAAKANMQFSSVNGFVRTLMNRLGGAGSGELAGAVPVERVQLAAAGSHLSDAGRVYAQAAGRPGAAAVGGTERGGAWTLVYGNDGKTSSDANAAGYRQDGVGFAFGADTAIDGRWRAGGAVNIGTQRADLDAGAGDVKTDGVSAAVYARYSGGPLTVDAIAGAGRNANKGARAVSVGGLARTASSDYDSDQRFAHVEVSYAIPKGSYRLEPVVALGYTRVDSPAYTETGADALNLMVNGEARESIKSYLGVRTVHELGGKLQLTVRALWSHEFGDADSALSSAQFAGAPGVGAFQTTGVDLPRDGALLGLGLSGEWRRNLSLFGDLAVEARSGQWNASFLAGARYTW